KRERGAPGLPGWVRGGDSQEGQPARRNHDRERRRPVRNRAGRPQDERPEREERVERPAVAVRIAELGNGVVPAEVPGEEGPEWPAVVHPAMEGGRGRPGFDASDHTPEHGGEPERHT